MLHNTHQSYTPALEPYELNERALIIDTETVGVGPSIEIVELALGDCSGEIVYHTLVRPLFNKIPRATKEPRFERDEFGAAPEWADVWAEVAPLVNNKLLVAYNAAFDRRALSAMRERYRQPANERGWRCAMQLVKRAVGARKNLTLADACALYNLAGGNHRADVDVKATCQLLRAVSSAMTR
jgi:DNA polymerase III epsilon subunit-like protein